MKQLQKGLQSAVKALIALATKIDEISKKLEESGKAKPATKSPRKPVKKSAPKKAVAVTASDQVLKIVNASKKGVNTSDLIGKTGFNTKKVQNIVFKLRKQGKIKNVSKGVYVKA